MNSYKIKVIYSALTAVLFLFIIPAMLIGQDIKALDEKYGFREAKFEMPVDSIKHIKRVSTVGRYTLYVSTNKNIKLGEYDIYSLAYFFYKGKLSQIEICTKGLANSDGVLEILQEAYGKGDDKTPNIARYLWAGERVIMMYNMNPSNGVATFRLFSRKIWKMEQEEEKRAKADAAKTL